MKDTADLVSFYEDAYTQSEASAGLIYARWRALGAVGKAEHIARLCARRAIEPSSTLEVGCGDGALLSELHRRGFGGSLHGLEITAAAVQIASGRPEIDSVELYDGVALAQPDGAFDLGVISHVLEHVPEPAMLLREVARVCAAVVIEVPLEANISARRSSKRHHSDEIGHLQHLDRAAARAIVTGAGLRVAAELDDPLPLAVHRFFADGALAQIRAFAKWALRSSLHRLAPALARRVFTVHYACLCLPPTAGTAGER